MTKRPNFLLIITDQHRADHLGCYGNSVVKTPHIDAIAARGTRFEQFYVATPICMPNRATLMTGRMPSLHGSRHNGIPLSLDATTFVEALAAVGWKTGLMGKCHLQNMSANPPERGMPELDPALIALPANLREAERIRDGLYNQELRPIWLENPDHDLTLPYYGFQKVDLTVGHGDRVTGHYGRWLEERLPGGLAMQGPKNQLPGNDYGAPQAWRTAIPEELYPTSYVAETTCDFLENHAKDGGDAPFFIQCSFPDPHHPFTPPGQYWEMYPPGDMALPPSFHSERPLPPHLALLHKERDAGKARRGGQRAFAISDSEVREAIALTYGMITMIDDAVGRVLATLTATGLDKDTVVIFTSDHGDFMGDHQLILKGALHYQGLVRVPFVWADPSAPAGGAVRGDLGGTLDIARTILARAGVAPYNGIQGRDLMSGAEPSRRMVIEEHQRAGYMGLGDGFRVRTLMDGRHRLTLYDDANGFGELYDLANDPLEQGNLYGEPEARALRQALSEALLHEMIQATDTSPLATGHGP